MEEDWLAGLAGFRIRRWKTRVSSLGENLRIPNNDIADWRLGGKAIQTVTPLTAIQANTLALHYSL